MLPVANQVGDDKIVKLEKVGDLGVDGILQRVEWSDSRCSGVVD